MARDKPDFGPVVRDGVLCRTSVSAIQAFDPETYAGCNRRWYFENVLGLKAPTTQGQKIGHEGHGQIEHYLKTGADVLQPFARAGKHLLPRPGADLHVEGGLATEEATRAAIALCAVQPPSSERDREATRLAGLAAAGIPLVGYIDVRHRRGEYVGVDGVVYKESLPDRTSEVIDHKFSADIDAYGKSADEVIKTVQMTGYTVYVANVEPGIEIVRNSHIYYQTRGAKTARKITALVVADEARRRWERVDGVVRSMIDVAKAADVKDVEPYVMSCDAYRGCPHRQFCPDLPTGTVFDLLRITKGVNMSGRGLFEDVVSGSNGVTTPDALPVLGLFADVPTLPITGMGLFTPGPQLVPPPASPSQSEYEALRASEIARLLAEDETYCLNCGAQFCAENTERLSDNTVRHIGCPGLHFGAVNPPGGAPPMPLELAASVDVATLATITDPEIRARAQALADEAARHVEEIAAKEGKKPGGRCPGGGQRLAISPKEASTKKKLCGSCGKELRIKPSEDCTEATLPSHNVPKIEAPPVETSPPSLPVEVSPLLPPFTEVPPALPHTVALSTPAILTEVPPLPVSIPPLVREAVATALALTEELLPVAEGPPPLPSEVPPLSSAATIPQGATEAREIIGKLLDCLGVDLYSVSNPVDLVLNIYDRLRAIR